MTAIVFHPSYEVDIGPHVFPTRKYRLVRDRLVTEGTAPERDVTQPTPPSDEQVLLVHTPGYVRRIKAGTLSRQEQVLLEVPFSPALREASWLCAGGAILGARRALEQRAAVHLGGGFHHAFGDHGEGFCLINDVAIAIRALQQDGAIRRAAVVDLDVHHGNGTAAIFQGDADVFTFSMHQENNYPAVKPPSDLDLGLDDGTGDAEYLRLLDRHLPDLLERHRPDLVFYLAGADPYQFDQLGGLGLTLDGLRRRDEVVFEQTVRAGIPIVVSLAGGYALNTDDTVEIHCNTVRMARAAVDSTTSKGLKGLS